MCNTRGNNKASESIHTSATKRDEPSGAGVPWDIDCINALELEAVCASDALGLLARRLTRTRLQELGMFSPFVFLQ